MNYKYIGKYKTLCSFLRAFQDNWLPTLKINYVFIDFVFYRKCRKIFAKVIAQRQRQKNIDIYSFKDCYKNVKVV